MLTGEALAHRQEAMELIEGLRDLIRMAGATPAPVSPAEVELAKHEARRWRPVPARPMVDEMLARIEADGAVHRDALIDVARRWGAI